MNRLNKLYGKVLEKNTFEQISKVLDKNNVPITEEVGFVLLDYGLVVLMSKGITVQEIIEHLKKIEPYINTFLLIKEVSGRKIESWGLRK